MDWCSHLFKNFPQFIVTHTVKGFSIVSEADVFLDNRNTDKVIIIQRKKTLLTRNRTDILMSIRHCERESRSVVSDSATPSTIQSMEFSRPEY